MTSDDTAQVPRRDQIADDIERTRHDLALTADELAARLNIKARVRQRARQAKDQVAAQLRTVRSRATDDQGRLRPAPIVIGVGSVLAAAAVTAAVLAFRDRGRR